MTHMLLQTKLVPHLHHLVAMVITEMLPNQRL
jgi:hypothetical protein